MRSDNVKEGTQQAPHRSLFNALGFTQEEMKKPMVGIVSSYNEIVPGHMNLDKIVDAVKLGVAEAGGVPVVFPAIAVCDGIAMGHVGMKYSLVTRDLIADSTECMALAHQFDALVMVPNCDKNVPGLLMAAARINVPTVFVSGGPMLAGHVKGQKRSLSSMFEAVGSHAAGTITDEDLLEFEEKTCPTCGSCSGMYTANSMNCLTEALGMGLRGNGTIPAVYSERIKLAKHAGMAVMNLLEKNIRPRDIMTKDAILNALTVDMALEQGREVYALPGRATDPLSGGCNRLIGQGAGLVSSPEEILGELLEEPQRNGGRRKKGAQGSLIFLEGVQGQLWEILDFNPLPVQELQRRYEERYGKAIAFPILYKELLELCTDGYAGQVGGGHFMRTMKT